MSNERDFFAPSLLLSFLLHLWIFTVGDSFYKQSQFSVRKAPTSMEIVLVEASMIQRDFSNGQAEPQAEDVIKKDHNELNDDIFLNPRAEGLQDIKNISAQKPAAGGNISTSQGAARDTAAAEANYLNPAPVYPSFARKKGWEGTVLLKVFVEENGKAGQVSLERSSGHKILDETAADTVKTWKFQPAREGHVKRSSWIRIPVQFRLIER